MNSKDLRGLHIGNGDEVALEFAPNVKGRVIKTHNPEHGNVTYDVEIKYVAGDKWPKPEVVRLKDLPVRCLTKLDTPIMDMEQYAASLLGI